MKVNPKARRKAREFAVQAIYQWQMTDRDPVEIEVEFHQSQDMSNVETSYFADLLRGVPTHVEQIDIELDTVLDRPRSSLQPVELAVLRIAVFELLFKTDVPFKAVINEALELSKKFGSVEGFKYVNAVLDSLVKRRKSADKS